MAGNRKDKYDEQSAGEVKNWIEELLSEKLADGSLIETLKDGIIICRLVNVIKPGSALYKSSNMPFVQMENIASFLRAASSIGVPQHELFETVDLYEQNDPVQVLITLRSLSRNAFKVNPDIPVIGPKLVMPNQRQSEFKKGGDNIPAWNTRQYGFMGGASQATEGVRIGGHRDIIVHQQKPVPPSPKIVIEKEKIASPVIQRRSSSPEALEISLKSEEKEAQVSIGRSFSFTKSPTVKDSSKFSPADGPSSPNAEIDKPTPPLSFSLNSTRKPAPQPSRSFAQQRAEDSRPTPVISFSINDADKPSPAPSLPALNSTERSPPKPSPKPFSLTGRPVARPKGPRQLNSPRPSAFNQDDSDDGNRDRNMGKKATVGMNLNSNNAHVNSSKVELDDNNSVYAYDEVYDTMKAAEKAMERESETDKLERKPKYIDQLLKSKSIRERDRLSAKDVLLKRERLNEGDEFADKEKFVTSAYKAQQEEIDKSNREEEESEKKNAPNNMTSFYKNYLQESEKMKEAVISASKNPSNVGGLTFGNKTSGESSIVEQARSINEAAGYEKVKINEEGEIVDDKQLFGAGLNVLQKKDTRSSSSTRDRYQGGRSPIISSSYLDRQTSHRDRKARQEAVVQLMEKEAQRQEEQQKKEKDDKIQQFKSRKTDDAALSSARERFLARKREAQSESHITHK